MTSQVILVTGGAGYIGANLVHRLKSSGHTVVVLDNLSSGSMDNLPPEILFYKGELGDADFLREIFERNPISFVFHFAAKKSVAESTENSKIFMETNVEGTKSLLNVMQEYGCAKLVFASTAAVYGDREVRKEGFFESDPLAPSNPYGLSKLLAEQQIGEYTQKSNLHAIVFRFFNVGMTEILLAESQSQDLLSVLSDCYKYSKALSIFGGDYLTPDGTCYRDFIHISDLLDALEMSITLMQEKLDKLTVLNLGSGSAISLGEVVSIGSKNLGSGFKVEFVDRRPGDVGYSLANVSSARQILGWEPRVDPREMFESFFEKLKSNSSW
jgi:UDP-glucose 4-epimerase